MISALESAPERSIILLHACAHNPTGVDPTQSQWKQIASVMRARSHFPFFDCAYQGFASGDLNADAWSIHYFIEQGFGLCIAQSFAKDIGLYGERPGSFHFVAAPGPNATDEVTRIASQLAIIQRSEISNPPAYGAKIASLILNDKDLFAMWEEDLRTMSGRIKEMRQGLRERLEKMGTPGKWDHITTQVGMFSFTGLTEKQVGVLREKWHVYMVSLTFLRACQQPKFGEMDVRVLLIAFMCRPKTVVSQWPALTPTILITLLKLSIASSGRRCKCVKYLTSRDETNTLDVKERESHWGMETRFKRVGIPQDTSEDA
jgi:aspartate/tyrosine/aromatic aminotransferase